MAQASLKGTPAIRALYWDFDDASLFGVYEQFLFGPAILVTPVLTENATSVDGKDDNCDLII
jgi:alpha-glucosidase